MNVSVYPSPRRQTVPCHPLTQKPKILIHIMPHYRRYSDAVPGYSTFLSRHMYRTHI